MCFGREWVCHYILIILGFEYHEIARPRDENIGIGFPEPFEKTAYTDYNRYLADDKISYRFVA